MTISYSGHFARLLVRWKGSVWKTTWKELISFLTVYYLIRLIYRFALHDELKTQFEKIIVEFDEFTRRIPLNFLLGFYVAAVVKRWWEQFELIVWPDDILNMLNVLMPPSANEEDEVNNKRRTVARHINLTLVLAWREMSVKVRKRFPTTEHIVKANLMTVEESELYEQADLSVRWYKPLVWVQSLVVAHCQETLAPAPIISYFLNMLFKVRRQCHRLHCYDWVCLPLVYTQVAALCTYGYFALCLIGRQFIDHRSPYGEKKVDYYVPIFSVLEFLFYVGWFKVGQDLMRPLEEDDDDFELNYIIDRNIQASLALINGFSDKQPSVVSMPFWNQRTDGRVPHTKVSSKLKNRPPRMHAYVSLKNPNKYQKEEVESFMNSDLPKDFKRWRYF